MEGFILAYSSRGKFLVVGKGGSKWQAWWQEQEPERAHLSQSHEAESELELR